MPQRNAADLGPKLMQALTAGDFDVFPPMAGQSCGIIADVLPAGEVVSRVVGEARATLGRLVALV